MPQLAAISTLANTANIGGQIRSEDDPMLLHTRPTQALFISMKTGTFHQFFDTVFEKNFLARNLCGHLRFVVECQKTQNC